MRSPADACQHGSAPGHSWKLGHSWKPPSPPEVFSFAFGRTEVETAASYDTATLAGTTPEVRSWEVSSPDILAISVVIGSPKIAVRDFYFDEGTEVPAFVPTAAASAQPFPRTHSKQTRIKPPADIVKFEDKLRYLLQPPLESVLRDGSLEVPFDPFPYQYEGIAFLYPRHAAILADEMGLGKTMQAVSTIRLLLHRRELQTVLLVCPKPLVTNWQREFAMWAPEIPVSVVEGNKATRQWHWEEESAPVKIANYELVVRDREFLDRDSSVLSSAPRFDLVVLDESQRIKNKSSATSQAVRSIERRRNWALTGTPVENSAEDLVGIFEFLAPGFLSAEMKPRRMGKAVSDYVLRRTKDLVLTDLPPKLFRDAEIELLPGQREAYDMAEGEGIIQLSEMGDSATIQHVFELVLRLKQICNFAPVDGSSAKVERLVADVEEIAHSGRKAIIFSQWVETLYRLKRRLAPFGPLEYHGKVPSGKRDAVIERFRNDPDSHVILMSYGAGSVGLNLQFANYVFLFDRWWNPAVEDQAINRAHRIGVAGPVTVTRFLTLGTIEERIDAVLQEKRELFETIFSFSGAEPATKLGMSESEIFGLFNLRAPRVPGRGLARAA